VVVVIVLNPLRIRSEQARGWREKRSRTRVRRASQGQDRDAQ
jgi:hypothetical protein